MRREGRLNLCGYVNAAPLEAQQCNSFQKFISKYSNSDAEIWTSKKKNLFKLPQSIYVIHGYLTTHFKLGFLILILSYCGFVV